MRKVLVTTLMMMLIGCGSSYAYNVDVMTYNKHMNHMYHLASHLPVMDIDEKIEMFKLFKRILDRGVDHETYYNDIAPLLKQLHPCSRVYTGTQSPFEMMCMLAPTEQVKSAHLLSCTMGDDPIITSFYHGYDVIVSAAAGGNSDTLNFLLDNGAEEFVPDSVLKTKYKDKDVHAGPLSLYMASTTMTRFDPDIIVRLANAGANLNERAYFAKCNGYTPIMIYVDHYGSIPD